MKNKLACSLLVGAGLWASLPAAASVIDFEDLAQPYELGGVGKTYTSNGFEFSYEAAPGEKYPTGLFYVGTSWTYNLGSTSLFSNSDGATTKLKRNSGGGFSLNSIDLAELNGPGATSVTFEGVKLDGQHVTQTFFLDGITGFESFIFSNDFHAVSSVTWGQGNNINLMPHMFDNVDVTAIPLPGSAGLFLSALGCIGAFFRRFGGRHRA